MKVVALLLAAGAGERLGAEVPKALCALAGRTLLEHALDSLSAHPDVSRIVVTAPAEYAADVAALLGARATVISGGATRQDSVRLGLDVLGADAEFVLVHDAARPFVPLDLIDRVIAALAGGADAAVPALAVTDTIKRVAADGSVVGTVDRRELRAVQTPQGFRRADLVSAHRYARTAGIRDVSDDAALMERHGARVVLVEGSEQAFKITHPWDLRLAELMLQDR